MRVTAVLSWVVILTLAVGLPVLHAVDAAMKKVATTRGVATRPTTLPGTLPGTGTDVLPADRDAPPPPVSLELRFASKYAVGTKLLFGVSDATLPDQLDKAAKSDTDRVAIAVVAGEIQGRDAAVKRLDAIDALDARQFERAYDGGDAPPGYFPNETLGKRYGFFADLAAAHGNPAAQRRAVDSAAKKAVYLAMTLLAVGIAALLAGLALLGTGVVLAAMGKLHWRTRPPVAPATYYVEAFAIYLVLLLGGSAATALLPAGLPIVIKLMPLSIVVVFAAAWPLIRGAGQQYIDRGDEQTGPRGPAFDPVFALPPPPAAANAGVIASPTVWNASPATLHLSNWKAYRQDVGLHAGTGVFKEIGFGIVGYVAGLPIVGLALLLVLLLSQLAEQTTSHPIVDTVDQTSVWSLLLLAAVFAPLTEEIMFRGLFVSHLRRGMGIVLTALLSGLIFAAVHPQGWLAIPALMSIGGWLAVVRQWRGSLIAPVTMHAINNGVIVLVMVGLLK